MRSAMVVWVLLVAAVAAAGEPPRALIELGTRVEQDVARLRGLPVRKPIHWETATRAEVRAYLDETLARQYRPGEIAAEGAAFRALGLIPASLDYREYILELVSEQVGGYYDPLEETFYLAAWIAPSVQETVIAHEMTHALQDQHFGIDELVERVRGNSDAQLARSALVEGEATLVMMLHAMQPAPAELDLSAIDPDGPLGSLIVSSAASEMPKFAEAPRALRALFLFPYVHGLAFVARGRKLGDGWELLDRAYQDLPASTEQILHPARYYLQRDPPTVVELGFLDGIDTGAWKPIHEDVLGEFVCRLLLGPLDDADERRRAAAGWDGDRLRVYRRGEHLAWVHLSVWDSGRDAVEYAGAFARTVPRRDPACGGRYVLQPLGQATRMRWKNEAGRVLLVVRRGVRVLVAEGFGAGVGARIGDAAW